MSIPLFKSTFRRNWVVGLIFLIIMLFYLGTFIGMYDPESTQSMEELMNMVPEELARALGIEVITTNLTVYIANYFYGMLVFIVPLIYVAVTGNRLVARHVDNGSMAYLLSTPNKRRKIAFTQAGYFLSSIAAMYIVVTGFTILLCQSAYPGKLDISAFIRLNACAFLLTAAVSSVCWFFSCLANETKYSIAFGAGLPVVFFLMNIVSGVSEKLGWLGRVSVYGMFDANGILSGSFDFLPVCVIYVLGAAALYKAGVLIFSKKNMPL